MTPSNGFWLPVSGFVHDAAAASQRRFHIKVGVSILRPQTLHVVPSALKRSNEGSAESDMVSITLHISQIIIPSVRAALREQQSGE